MQNLYTYIYVCVSEKQLYFNDWINKYLITVIKTLGKVSPASKAVIALLIPLNKFKIVKQSSYLWKNAKSKIKLKQDKYKLAVKIIYLVLVAMSLDSKSLQISSCWVEDAFSALMRKVQLRSIDDDILFIYIYYNYLYIYLMMAQRSRDERKS